MAKGLAVDNGRQRSSENSVAYECGVGGSTSDCVQRLTQEFRSGGGFNKFS